jgi:hypothetical protein
LTAVNANGWQGAVKLNLRPWIGCVFDASGNYGERRMIPTRFQPRETHDGNWRQHIVVFGPEIRAFRGKRLTGNARALIGATYVSDLVLPLREPLQLPKGPVVTEFRLGRSKPVTGVVGGSLDYRITERLSWRFIQLDLVVTHLGGENVKQLRVSTGVVFTIG